MVSLTSDATSIGGGVAMERGGGGRGVWRCWESAIAMEKRLPRCRRALFFAQGRRRAKVQELVG